MQPKPDTLTLSQTPSVWHDPTVLRAAKQIYLAYFQIHAQRMRRPLGVAVDRETYRGLLLFARRPVLLPGEAFIPFEQIEAEIY
ncbi:MAG: hypothetical protein HC835_03970 [Oscillatoriales cyanobacterium RM2_1_1]|nr:hypothetical protein [Oscillatoriales cyanobacterium SM2_3_0]NJO44840.1 hypothetical protein [Oscillatoriales cyanobacterium RM2_1_1]